MENLTTAIVEYEPIAAALASVEKYRGIVLDLATEKGMREARALQREVAAPRIALEKARTKLKADVLERGRLIDGEAKRIGALFAAIEDPIVDQIKAGERREQEAREAAIRAEQERLAAEERARKEAEEAKLAAERAEIARQRAALEAEQRQRDEAERARRAAAEAEDRARLAKIEEEERAARKRIEEAEAQARAQRQAEEDRLRAERAKLDAGRREEEERQREARERNEAALSEIRGIQHQVIIAQQGRLGVRDGGTIACIEETLAETEAWQIDGERFGALTGAATTAKNKAVAEIHGLLAAAKASKEERLAREAQEAAAREEQRKAVELLDARGMLDTFRQRFGHLKPFAKVVKAINDLPAYTKVAA